MLKALRTFPHELVWLGVVWISLSCVESFTPWSPFLKLFKFTSSMDLRIWINTILPRLWHGGMINILYYNDRDGDIIEVDSNTNPCYWTNRWICNINEDLIFPIGEFVTSSGCVSPRFIETGAPRNVSHGAPHPPGRGKCRGRAPDPGRRVPVEHCKIH